MFNNANGYSLSDIAAATGNGNGNGFFGGDSGAWWIIILFLFCFAGGWGNGGFGMRNGGGGGGDCASNLAYSFDMNGLQGGQTALLNGITNGFYNLNTGLLTSTNSIQNSIAQLGTDNLQNTFTLAGQMNNLANTQQACCCDTKALLTSQFAELNYNLATQECAGRQATTDATRAIIDNQNANTRSILDFMVQEKLDSLHSENNDLRNQISQANQTAALIQQLRPTPQPSYLVQNPYYIPYGYSGYGYRNTCGTNTTCGTCSYTG